MVQTILARDSWCTGLFCVPPNEVWLISWNAGFKRSGRSDRHFLVVLLLVISSRHLLSSSLLVFWVIHCGDCGSFGACKEKECEVHCGMVSSCSAKFVFLFIDRG